MIQVPSPTATVPTETLEIDGGDSFGSTRGQWPCWPDLALHESTSTRQIWRDASNEGFLLL